MKSLVKFIKDRYHYVNGRVKGYFKTHEIGIHFNIYANYCVNMLITGIIIYYIISYHNFISYGLASALIMYYIKWLRKITLTKDIEEVEKL